MATIADLVKEFYGITGSGSTNRLTIQAKTACGFADIPTKQLAPEQFEAVKNWLKNDAISKGKYNHDVEPTVNGVETQSYAHEIVPTPTQQVSTIVQEQILEPKTESRNKMKVKAIRGVEAKLLHIRTPENKRKAVWLEPVFCDALERVTAGKNQSQWLTDILVNVGDGNLASAVRCSIVKELLA